MGFANILAQSRTPILNPHPSNGAGYPRIEFQFPPSGDLTIAKESGYAEASSLSRNDPILQFTKGELKTYTFEAMLFATNVLDDVQKMYKNLEAARDRDPKLGRPPLWNFHYGDLIDDTVVVSSIGNVRIGDLRSDGTPRSIILTITLKRYVLFDVAATDPNAREHNTFYRIARENELWETLAKEQYQQPIWGEILRRLNPDQPNPTFGKTVMLLDADKLRGVVVTPDSVPLRRTAEGIALRRSMFALRGKTYTSTVLKKG